MTLEIKHAERLSRGELLLRTFFGWLYIGQLQADWETERAELKALLEKFNDTETKRKIYRHIRAGRLNIQHALIFFREHYRHHWPQIKRLL